MELEEFKMRAPNVKTVLAFADKYGFKSVRPKLEKWATERSETLDKSPVIPQKKEVQKNYKRIAEKGLLNVCLQEIEAANQFAFKVWQKDGNATGISLCATENNVFFIPFAEEKALDLFAMNNASGLPNTEISKFLSAIFNDKNLLKITAELKEQWHLLEKYLQADLELFPYHDVALMSYVLDSSEHGHSLPDLAQICLGETLESEEKLKNEDLNAPDNTYVFDFTDCILPIYSILKNRLFAEHKTYVYETIERRLVEILQGMEKHGIKVDTEYLKRLDIELSEDLKKIEAQIYALAGEEFNIASPKQKIERAHV